MRTKRTCFVFKCMHFALCMSIHYRELLGIYSIVIIQYAKPLVVNRFQHFRQISKTNYIFYTCHIFHVPFLFVISCLLRAMQPSIHTLLSLEFQYFTHFNSLELSKFATTNGVMRSNANNNVFSWLAYNAEKEFTEYTIFSIF